MRQKAVAGVSVKASAFSSTVSPAYNPCAWVAEVRGLCHEFEGHTVGSSPAQVTGHKKKKQN